MGVLGSVLGLRGGRRRLFREQDHTDVAHIDLPAGKAVELDAAFAAHVGPRN